MKQINKILTTAIAVLLLFGTHSCEEEFLEITPKSELASNVLFASEAGADLFVNELYMSLPDPEKTGEVRFTPNNTSHYDNLNMWSPFYLSCFTWARSSMYSNRAYEASTWLYWPEYNVYPFTYEKVTKMIRNTNLFLEEVEKAKDNFSEKWRLQRVAETRVLRAHLYHQLWKGHGGVPLITKVLQQSTMGDDIFQPSVSITELYEFMVTELDEAADVLPDEINQTGRVTKGAALALKAYLELYMGDIAANPKPAAIDDGTLGNANTYYAACAATCQEIMDLETYSLFPDYNDQFLAVNNWNSEGIWVLPKAESTNPSLRTYNHGPFIKWPGAVQVHGSYIPTQNLVDMYRMDNGLPIDDPNSGYDPQKPFDNREERFYQTILYDSAMYRGEQWLISGGTEGVNSLYRANAGPNNTGYRRIKGVEPSLTADNIQTGEISNGTVFRYAEVLLMFAEAKFKLNQIDAPAIAALDEVRARGGLPTIAATYASTPSQSELLDIIWHERAVELCFEGYKSYYDLMRTRKAETLLNQPCRGIRNDGAGGYEITTLQQNVWPDDRYYYFPFYQEWLETNPVWMDPANQVNGRTAGQNPGY